MRYQYTQWKRYKKECDCLWSAKQFIKKTNVFQKHKSAFSKYMKNFTDKKDFLSSYKFADQENKGLMVHLIYVIIDWFCYCFQQKNFFVKFIVFAENFRQVVVIFFAFSTTILCCPQRTTLILILFSSRVKRVIIMNVENWKK